MGISKAKKIKEMKIWFLATFLFAKLCYGCNIIGMDSTPVKFRNHTTVMPGVYKNHHAILNDNIRLLIKQKVDPFDSKENDSMTEVFIDTILYSPKKDRIAFFAITKNSNDKLIGGGNKSEYHYNAHCFIADLGSDSYINNIYWVRAFNLSNYKSLKEASERIRKIHFKEFKRRVDDKGKSLYKYNLDDVRFWDGPVWK